MGGELGFQNKVPNRISYIYFFIEINHFITCDAMRICNRTIIILFVIYFKNIFIAIRLSICGGGGIVF